MKFIVKPITIRELDVIAKERFGEMTKAVVDVEKEIMVVDAELHADQEALLLKEGSKQKNLWGINLYPELFNDPDWIEFDSMINLRPSGGNNSRGVDDVKLQDKIRKIVDKLVAKK
jgi:hypothetical protein